MRVKIKNWDNFQHYSKRNPPWVKLHNSTMTGETWVMSSDKDRLLMLTALMVASRDDNHGEIPSEEYMQRVAYLSKKPNFQPLIEAGFLVAIDMQADDSTMLADASVSVSVSDSDSSLDVTKYGEFQRVLLTDGDAGKLREAYGCLFDAAIDLLDGYIESHGKKYKSHYAVMRKNSWVWNELHGVKSSDKAKASNKDKI